MPQARNRDGLVKRSVLWTSGLAIAGAACVTILQTPQSSSPPPQFSTGLGPPLTVLPERIDLSTLGPGQMARGTVALRNLSERPVVIDQIETSCPCVSVSAGRSRVTPGDGARLSILFDPRDEPDYRGGLAVTYTGRSPDGTVIFHGRVDVAVADPPGEPISTASATNTESLEPQP